MKNKLVGNYILGAENLDLYLRDDDGGNYNGRPDDNGCAIIEIGKDTSFDRVICNLIHELIELSFIRMECAYFMANDYAFDNGNRFFACTHRQMSEISARVGLFVNQCFNDLKKEYKNCQK